MKVLAKCSKDLMPKMFTFPRSKSVNQILNVDVLESVVFSSVRVPLLSSPFAFSETAKRSKIDNNFTNANYLVNSLAVIAFFNRILSNMVLFDKLISDDVKNLVVTSAYRSPKLNEYVGGSRTSLHLYGLALDLFSNDISIISSISRHVEHIIKNYEPIHGSLFPYELISYSPNRIHIGFKWFELAQ